MKDSMHNKRLGREGEAAAVKYLEKSGYKIIERNFRTPFNEVDIIASTGETVAFIEVKTRLSDSFGLPNEAVTPSRQRLYFRAAEYYFSDRPIDCIVRFDIIEVFRGKINHIEDAFRP